MPDAPYVFISYASADRERVLPLVDRLEQAGITTWIDREGIHGGANYAQVITEAIKGSTVLLVMCSAASLASRNVRQELALGWRFEKPYLPLLLEQVTVSDEVAYWLEAATVGGSPGAPGSGLAGGDPDSTRKTGHRHAVRGDGDSQVATIVGGARTRAKPPPDTARPDVGRAGRDGAGWRRSRHRQDDVGGGLERRGGGAWLPRPLGPRLRSQCHAAIWPVAGDLPAVPEPWHGLAYDPGLRRRRR